MEELKICKEIINKVKWYTERKDYNGLKLYIDEKLVKSGLKYKLYLSNGLIFIS